MRAKKIDTSQSAIVDHLRNAGWCVSVTATVGNGFPDLVVSSDGFTGVVECKTGANKLRPLQEKFKREWDGIYIVARNGEEALMQLEMAKRFSRMTVGKRLVMAYDQGSDLRTA